MDAVIPVKYLDALGYNLVAVPKGKSLPKDSITVDNGYKSQQPRTDWIKHENIY